MPPNPEPAIARRGLTLRERRSLGLTLWNILRVLREMKREDPKALDGPRDELAEQVFGRVVDENPEAAAGIDWENIDWAKVLKFIMDVIAMLIAVFFV